MEMPHATAAVTCESMALLQLKRSDGIRLGTLLPRSFFLTAHLSHTAARSKRFKHDSVSRMLTCYHALAVRTWYPSGVQYHLLSRRLVLCNVLSIVPFVFWAVAP